MTYQPAGIADDPSILPKLPAWVTSGRAETPEDVMFLSGAVLTHLHLVARHASVPHSLLRDRLAFLAAEACLTRAGRPERLSDLRDEVHLARPGEALTPGGAMVARWRDAVRAPVGKPMSRQAPLCVAAETLRNALTRDPSDQVAALIGAETALARSLGWDRPVPILSLGLKGRDMALDAASLRQACARVIVTAGPKVLVMAQDLAQRAERLHSVAPKLRAKGAGAAIRVFLEQEALSPTIALSPVVRGSTARMTDRAARRLCDRLVELGCVRELSGRASFRLYGV
ncbi:DUF1403 family protein [Ruegeria pomeroyi]|nr:DUF1403 family protein [Ruegeria pomeroyi]MCE8534756.1 DUF1403 family protein [Ruegeria pomeroyi]